MQKKNKTKRIPSSIAELRRILRKTDEKYVYAFVDNKRIWFDCSSYYPRTALWAMPLADIAKRKGRAKR